MDRVTAADRSVTTLLPGTNLARLVMVHWHDTGTTKKGHDCSSGNASLGYLTADCLDLFDSVLSWAAETAGLWVTITLRGALAAGDGGPGFTVFNNATLRMQLIEMWRFLARR